MHHWIRSALVQITACRLFGDKPLSKAMESTLVQVMAWCRQATSHHLSQCWPRSLTPYGITRPQWVKFIRKPSQWSVWISLAIESVHIFAFGFTWQDIGIPPLPFKAFIKYIIKVCWCKTSGPCWEQDFAEIWFCWISALVTPSQLPTCVRGQF